jgi:hypothetical protein
VPNFSRIVKRRENTLGKLFKMMLYRFHFLWFRSTSSEENILFTNVEQPIVFLVFSAQRKPRTQPERQEQRKSNSVNLLLYK